MIRIAVSSEPRLLHILRCVVRCLAQEAGFAAEEADCLSMAIDEAASNIIRHTYSNCHDARLALEIRTYPDRMEFMLEDSGPKVRLEDLAPRPLDEVRPGGLGTYFIKCFMDSVAFDEDFPDGNRLQLVKYLPRKGVA
jgi:anti-sigma regulatory factor (Ser/Thr protein kinase)